MELNKVVCDTSFYGQLRGHCGLFHDLYQHYKENKNGTLKYQLGEGNREGIRQFEQKRTKI